MMQLSFLEEENGCKMRREWGMQQKEDVRTGWKQPIKKFTPIIKGTPEHKKITLGIVCQQLEQEIHKFIL